MSDSRTRPAVTVVIPCFNQGRFLPAAVASVRAQDHQHVECIVVDDGSTDGTATIASELGMRLLQQPNRGVSEARNAGLAAAQGDLVVFLDADDELLPGALGRRADVLASDPAAAAVVGRCQAMDVAGHPVAALHVPVDASNAYEQWLSRNFVWAPGAAMFRRRELDAIGGFPAGLGPAADYAVYLRLAREGRVRVIADEVARYRQHEANMSRDPALMLRATLAVLRREGREAAAGKRNSIRRARRVWADWYGEQIVHRLRTDWRAGRRGAFQVRAFATLVRHAPWVALRHLRHKAGLTLVAACSRTMLLCRRAVSTGRRKVAP
ncbi:MAG: glycosyltransferase [Burkholderiales bacterium]